MQYQNKTITHLKKYIMVRISIYLYSEKEGKDYIPLENAVFCSTHGAHTLHSLLGVEHLEELLQMHENTLRCLEIDFRHWAPFDSSKEVKRMKQFLQVVLKMKDGKL